VVHPARAIGGKELGFSVALAKQAPGFSWMGKIAETIAFRSCFGRF
jgi:hypothetical protein